MNDRQKRERGEAGSFEGDIYGTGERNPWEFGSLAYESNSSSTERQTFNSENVVRNNRSR